MTTIGAGSGATLCRIGKGKGFHILCFLFLNREIKAEKVGSNGA